MAGDYKAFFNAKLKAAVYSSSKDIPADKKDDFFDMIDKQWKGEKHDEKDEPGNSNESFSSSRAGRLLAFNAGIEEGFYKSGDGQRHSARKENGMGNVSARKKKATGGGEVSSRTNVSHAKPGV